MSIATLSVFASTARGAVGRGRGRSGNAGSRTALPHLQHNSTPPTPAKPKTTQQPKATNNQPIAPDLQPQQAPISDTKIKSADEFFKLINASVTVAQESATKKITLKIGNKTIDITNGITKSMLPELKQAGIEISDNLFAAIARGSKLETEMTAQEKMASKPDEISLDELNIFLEENLKEFAKMQGATDLKALFQVYNGAKDFKRASEDDRKAIEGNASKLKNAVQDAPTVAQPQAEVKSKWVAVHTKTDTYFDVKPGQSHDLVCYAAEHLSIDLSKDVSDADLERLSKYISFIPWLLKNMPDTAKNSEYYKLPDWLRNQQVPSSLKDEDVKEWYKKILEKKTEVAETVKGNEEDAELQATKANEDSRSGLGEKLTSDKKASEEHAGNQA